MNRFWIVLLIVLALLLGQVVPAFAGEDEDEDQDDDDHDFPILGHTIFNWTGSGDGFSWDDEDNWDVGASFPGNADDQAIFLSGSDNITTDASIIVGSVDLTTGFSGSISLGATFSIESGGLGPDGIMHLRSGSFNANGHQLTIEDGAQLRLESGGTLIGGPLMIHGEVTEFDGTYTHNSTKVIFETETSNPTIHYLGGKTFYNVSFEQNTGNDAEYRINEGFVTTIFRAVYPSSSSSLTLVVDHASQIEITTVLYILGISGNLITLVSSTSGTQFDMKVGTCSIYGVDYVDVKDSNANPGRQIKAYHSTDSGNNDNWKFQGGPFKIQHANCLDIIPL